VGRATPDLPPVIVRIRVSSAGGRMMSSGV